MCIVLIYRDTYIYVYIDVTYYRIGDMSCCIRKEQQRTTGIPSLTCSMYFYKNMKHTLSTRTLYLHV